MKYNQFTDDYYHDATTVTTTTADNASSSGQSYVSESLMKRYDSYISQDTYISTCSSTATMTNNESTSENGKKISYYGSIVTSGSEEDDSFSINDGDTTASTTEKSSTVGSALNLVNAIMGTGIIGLPLALHLCGFWLGLCFSAIIAYITCMTMHITILCGLKTNTNSLVSLSKSLIGKTGAHIVNIIIFFHTAGTAVSYYILLGDTLPSLIATVFPELPVLSDRRNVVFAFGLFCTLPLSLSRSTAGFAKWSALSIFLLTMMLIGVLVRVPHYISLLDKIELETAPVSERMFKGLAIMSLSFGCSQNLFGEYTASKDQRPSKWLLTCSIAIGMAFMANMVFAILTYICFGKNVLANILLNFPQDDPGIRLVKLALGLFMILTIPLCIHPCRETVFKMFGVDAASSTNRQHYSITIGVFAIILYFGATLTSLGKVFSFIGGFSTTILGFLLPGAAYIYLFSKDLFPIAMSGSYDSYYKSVDQGSWKLYTISIISIFIALPVIYCSVKDVFSV